MQWNEMVNQDRANRLEGIRCFALDMDGTFYLGDRLLPGAREFLQAVERTGRDYVFLTNNSSKSRSAYLEKLERLGVRIRQEQLVTSGQATIRYIQKQFPGKTVYLLGNEALSREFRAAGLELVQESPDLVVTAYDTTLDYEKMCKVCDFVREGRTYIATHPDFNCPTDGGYVPDIGAIHAFIHASTGRMPETVIGKPNREIMECALEQTGHAAGETAMVGDRLYTDIAVAGNVPRLTGILVLSGESALPDLDSAQVKPHLIFDSLAQMTPLL